MVTTDAQPDPPSPAARLLASLWSDPQNAPRFVLMWWFTRRWRRLWLGLPAVVLLVGLPVVGAIGLRLPTEQSQKFYDGLALDAFSAGDDDSVELWTQRILRADPDDDAARLRWARSLHRSGDTQRAAIQLARLTPNDGTGYGPAHRWVAERLLADESQQSNEQLRLAIHHLERGLEWGVDDEGLTIDGLCQTQMVLAKRLVNQQTATPDQLAEACDLLEAALDRNPQHVDGHILLANVYQQLRRPDAAIARLQRVASRRPDIRLLLADLRMQAGDRHAAMFELSRAREDASETLRQRPDDIETRLRLFETHMKLGEFAHAAELIAEALAAPPSDDASADRLRTAWVTACIAQTGVELRKTEPEWPHVLRLLDAAQRQLPADPRLLTTIALVAGRYQGVQFDPVRQSLEDALATGTAPVTCHLLLGTGLGSQGEIDRGIAHLRLVLQAEPNHPVALNNLAMLLLEAAPPQPDEALRFAARAVTAAPHVVEIHDTHGQALFAMGRYDEALTELETAIALKQGQAKRHNMLADIYESRSNDRMADRHRQLARELQPLEAASQ